MRYIKIINFFFFLIVNLIFLWLKNIYKKIRKFFRTIRIQFKKTKFSIEIFVIFIF